MTVSGRSMDDQPLAAYSRRGTVDVGDDEPEQPVLASVPWHDPDEATDTAPRRTRARHASTSRWSHRTRPAGDAVIRLPKPALGPASRLRAEGPRLVAGAGFVVDDPGRPGAPRRRRALRRAPPAPTPARAPRPAGPVAVEPGSATLVLTGSVEGDVRADREWNAAGDRSGRDRGLDGPAAERADARGPDRPGHAHDRRRPRADVGA